MITHACRLKQQGDYLRYDAANFQFILYRDPSGNVSGVHNLNGLNGETIVQSVKGTIDTDVLESDSFSIHVKVDRMGFIWVNLDSSEVPEVPWEEDFEDIDVQPRFGVLNTNEEYEFDHEWEMTGEYNWKILADNYNECYHCATTHPDLKEMADLETYSVTTPAESGYILHNVRGRPGGKGEEGFKVHPTYYFPSTSMNVSPHFFFMQRFVPHGPLKSTMRYEVYRHKDAPEEAFRSIADMYQRVMSEDKALCEASQKNLNRNVFVNGEMHPKQEQGPLFFQAKCRELVMEHREKELEEKVEIRPAQVSWSTKPATVSSPVMKKRKYMPTYSFSAPMDTRVGPPFASVAA